MAKDVEQLKKDYAKVKKKHKLPEFKTLNEEFDIEKIDEKKTELLLREIRRKIEQRASNFLKMLEEFLNPQFASMASLTMIKSFSESDKKLIKAGYQNLVNLMLESAILEVNYEEKKEAEFIKQALKDWQDIKKDLKELLIAAERIWKKKKEVKKDKHKYFG